MPSDVKDEGKKHQVKTVSLINTIEQARDAVANRYALSVCSNYGFSSKRNSEGIARRSGHGITQCVGVLWTTLEKFITKLYF